MATKLKQRFDFLAMKRMLYVADYTIQATQSALGAGDDADMHEVRNKVIRARRRIKMVLDEVDKNIEADPATQ